MPLEISDEETNRLVQTLADLRRVGLEEAVKQAVRNELLRSGEEKPALRERLRHLQDRVSSRATTGLQADKAFFDGLNGEA